MTKDAKYIYGVITSAEAISFGPIGISGRGDEVYTVPYRDLAAVVSDCPLVDYKAIRDKERVVRDLAAHQAVIEEVMQRFTVLPVKFGTTAKDEGEVETVLRQGHFALKEAHAAIQDKVEVEVVATWDLPSVFQEISAEEPIAKLKARIEGMSRLRSTPDRIKVGKLVYESLNRQREKYQQEILSVLVGCALDLQKNSLMNDEMVMNVAFLLDKGQQGAFDRRLDELDEKLGGRLNFRRIGPLPPYSFSTVEVRPMTYQEVQGAQELLGLGQEANLNEVKQAYYALAQEHHPDAQPGDKATDLSAKSQAGERFAQIAAAYQLLSNYCLGQAAAQGITAKKEAEGYRCSFAPAAIKESMLITVRRMGGETL
ncbi:MAG: GvpL/GvpF family gas vesicle protein [Anaerolineae bacterium]|nr:GvpL/GvpF family gas vesicle protein [Anaerolineae bacterium]